MFGSLFVNGKQVEYHLGLDLFCSSHGLNGVRSRLVEYQMIAVYIKLPKSAATSHTHVVYITVVFAADSSTLSYRKASEEGQHRMNLRN